MPNSVASATRRALDWPAKRALAAKINKTAIDLLRMPDSRSTWPRYRKATDRDSSLSIEYHSNGNKVDSLLFHDGNELHNLAIDNLTKLSDDKLKTIYDLLTQRRGAKHLVISETQEPPTYAPGNRAS